MYLKTSIPDTQKELLFLMNNAINLFECECNSKMHGVYAIFNDDNICVYVGQSVHIASRLATHIHGKYRNADHILFWDVTKIGFSDFFYRSKESQTKILNNCENYLIKKLQPCDNILVDLDIVIDDDDKPCCISDNINVIEIYEDIITIVENSDMYTFFTYTELRHSINIVRKERHIDCMDVYTLIDHIKLTKVYEGVEEL